MQPQLFTVGYLQFLVEPNGAWYSDSSPQALVGRCLLDTMEYFSTPELPGRFHDLADAHAIRLSVRCLSNSRLNRREQLNSLAGRLTKRLASLRKRRHKAAPFYGDDYWDWASILECFLEVKDTFSSSIITREIFDDEMDLFQNAVEDTLPFGLTTDSEGEWYGPATAAAAHKILQKWARANQRKLESTLAELKKQALEKIVEGEYRRRPVPEFLTLWHYGQVVHEFPDKSTTEQQRK